MCMSRGEFIEVKRSHHSEEASLECRCGQKSTLSTPKAAKPLRCLGASLFQGRTKPTGGSCVCCKTRTSQRRKTKTFIAGHSATFPLYPQVLLRFLNQHHNPSTFASPFRQLRLQPKLRSLVPCALDKEDYPLQNIPNPLRQSRKPPSHHG